VSGTGNTIQLTHLQAAQAHRQKNLSVAVINIDRCCHWGSQLWTQQDEVAGLTVRDSATQLVKNTGIIFQ